MKQCQRCQLLSPDHLEHCQYCHGLSDIQCHDFLQERNQQQGEASTLGKVFMMLAFVILVLLLFND